MMEDMYTKWYRPTTLEELIKDFKAAIPHDDEDPLAKLHEERYSRYRDDPST
jgi:hypothetical protein